MNEVVNKSHPEIEFRGCLDTLDATIVLTSIIALEEGDSLLSERMWEVQDYVRGITRSHACIRPLLNEKLFGYTMEELHDMSHNPKGGHLFVTRGTIKLMAYVNMVRVQVRTAERAAARAFDDDRVDIIQALNALSSAIYVLMCWMNNASSGEE